MNYKIIFYVDCFRKENDVIVGEGCISYYRITDDKDIEDINEFSFNFSVDNKEIYDIKSLGDRSDQEVKEIVIKNKKNLIKSLEKELLSLLDSTTKKEKNNVFETYNLFPNNYKNNLKDLYILDGIYTAYPSISEEDAQFIYSICKKVNNENVNPFSVSHYLTDHYSRGNIFKEELEKASSGDIISAVFNDDLNYLPLLEEIENEK